MVNVIIMTSRGHDAQGAVVTVAGGMGWRTVSALRELSEVRASKLPVQDRRLSMPPMTMTAAITGAR
jgi:hypothetical protein